MAQYKYSTYLNQSDHAEYDTLYAPGDNCPNSGIIAAKPMRSRLIRAIRFHHRTIISMRQVEVESSGS